MSPTLESYNPARINPDGLGYSAFARRYLRNRIRFLFLRLLRCFNSPGITSSPYFIQMRMTAIKTAGFSHSEISGSKRICRSPKLIAAYHVLHRLVSPRHPLIARNSLHCRFLTLKDKYSSRVVLFYYSLFYDDELSKNKNCFVFKYLVTLKWWALVDSNHRPPRYQHDALTN